MQDFTIAAETYISQKIGANETINLTRFVLAYVPGLDPTIAVDRTQTLPPVGQRVFEALVFSSGFVADNQVVYSLVMDTAIGDFDYNWIGLLDDTGATVDDATLIFVAELADKTKLKTVGGQQGDNITRNILLQFSGASDATGIAVPAEAWQLDFSHLYQRLWKWAPDNYVALSGDHLKPNNLVEPSSINLAENPTDTTVIDIMPSGADYNANPVTIPANGLMIMGVVDDVEIKNNLYHYRFSWEGGLIGWLISKTGVAGELA